MVVKISGVDGRNVGEFGVQSELLHETLYPTLWGNNSAILVICETMDVTFSRISSFVCQFRPSTRLRWLMGIGNPGLGRGWVAWARSLGRS